MSHAETLRGMASGSHPGLSYASVVALIAGVEALEAIGRVREAARLIDLFEGNASTELEATGRDYFLGRSDAYTHARDLITEALGGDRE